MLQKAQASLEYLMTYGWALVMIITIVGALMFAGTGGVNQESCTSFLHLLCKGIGAEGSTLVLVLQNTTGQKITINPFDNIAFDGDYGYAIIKYGDLTYTGPVTIGPGAEFTVKGIGMALADQISITYTEQATGLTRTETSNMNTGAEAEANIITACGYEIESPGLYILGNDLSWESGPSCITIQTDNVTLDCQEKTITGAGRTNTGIIGSDVDESNIVNCNIENFHIGMNLSGSDNIIIGGNQVNNNDYGMQYMTLSRSRLINNTVNDNEFDGIRFMPTQSTNNLLFNNTTNDNGFNGIRMFASGSFDLHNVLTDNTSCGNQNADFYCYLQIVTASGNKGDSVYQCSVRTDSGTVDFEPAESCP